MVKKIEISDETYEKIKNQLINDEFEYYGNYVLIRSYSGGCFAGVVVVENEINRTVVLNHCRRLWYWDGAASLSQLAMKGVKEPKNCKFTQETMNHRIYEIVETIPCTKEAQKNIRGVWIWKK